MEQELEKKSLVELCDLLVARTTELLKMMEQKTKNDGLYALKKEVEMIQAAIKSHKNHVS